MTNRPIAVVIRENATQLMALPGVEGVAQGIVGGKTCIKILVKKTVTDPQDFLPSVLDGYPVVIELSGPIHALYSVEPAD